MPPKKGRGRGKRSQPEPVPLPDSDHEEILEEISTKQDGNDRESPPETHDDDNDSPGSEFAFKKKLPELEAGVEQALCEWFSENAI